MHKPSHKEQQQESHSTLSGKYFKAMSKWRRRWQLRTPPCAASSGKPEQPVRGISWQTELNPAPAATGPDLLPFAPPAPPGYPHARSAPQHPCPTCHFCSITSCLLTSIPHTGRQPRHTSRKPVFQSAKNLNKALPMTTMIKTCNSWGWLLPPQPGLAVFQVYIWRGRGFSRNHRDSKSLCWETPPRLWLLSVAIQYLRQHL